DFVVFFFQAEDGIRDGHVTGVQTCALPILGITPLGDEFDRLLAADAGNPDGLVRLLERPRPGLDVAEKVMLGIPDERTRLRPRRSEERRVGKEGRTRRGGEPETER